MHKPSNEITGLNRVHIYASAGVKIMKGMLARPFFGEALGSLFIGKGATLTQKNMIIVGRNVRFESYCEVQGLSRSGITLGDNVSIGRSAMIRPSSYYGTGELGEGLSMGENSSIGPLCYIGCAGMIEIGANVMLGPRVSLFAENHVFQSSNLPIKDQGVNRKGIVIEDNCWIGSGTIVLDGVTVGSGSVIAAGTMVTKDVPKNSVVMNRRSMYVTNRDDSDE